MSNHPRKCHFCIWLTISALDQEYKLGLYGFITTGVHN